MRPSINIATLVGLVTLLTPVLTMFHELGGHALACVATGHVPTQLGAYYVDCSSAVGWDGRLVAMAGPAVDVLVFVAAYLGWRRVREPWSRLALWIVFTVKGMVAAGYWLFSGVLGLGDWAPGDQGGMGAMAHPLWWRGVLTVTGLIAYLAVTRLSMRTLDTMVGGGVGALSSRRRIAMTLYLLGGAVAVVVGLFNPIGIGITLVSAVASSFGGTAGLINVAFHRVSLLPPAAFRVDRHLGILAAGIVVTAAFALVLGPTIRIG